MGKITGFLDYKQQDRNYRPVNERVQNYREFVIPLQDEELVRQSARCMDCGIPYCHEGCPVDNIIPDWNDLVYNGDFKKALDI
ncbi:MAG: glutamate synthase, partial [Pseudomonadota bacterium]|nr:glutamate synthase [Pseudomonadota bacterium]